jgi:hypothetical protein
MLIFTMSSAPVRTATIHPQNDKIKDADRTKRQRTNCLMGQKDDRKKVKLVKNVERTWHQIGNM